MISILLAEDDEIMRISVSDRLKRQGWLVDEAEDGITALDCVNRKQYNIVLSDIRMPGLDGISLLKKIQDQNPATDIIMMTAYGSVESAIDSMKVGAADYILKPFDMDDLIIRIKRLLQNQEVKLRCEVLEANCDFSSDRQLIGSSIAMKQVFSLIEQAAPTNATILITGESGTGKELAARAIHRNSKRNAKPFVSINCAAIPDGLMESELFGHERGAFTGADQQRKGKFELANEGTLLLDELGDLPAPLQAKLLRVLQESQFERVGGGKSITVDVRILACTSKDLSQEVAEGRFRQDLLYRLQVIPLQMPPLRDHKEDIEELCLAFLDEFNTVHGRSRKISPEVIECLKNYDFPGNVRELRNLMERASVLCRDSEITRSDLPVELTNTGHMGDGYSLAENLAAAEKQILQRALTKSGGNKTEASKLLGISRKNLWEKLKSHQMG